MIKTTTMVVVALIVVAMVTLGLNQVVVSVPQPGNEPTPMYSCEGSCNSAYGRCVERCRGNNPAQCQQRCGQDYQRCRSRCK